MKPRVIALLFVIGMLLGQLAWMSAVPPYRGIDEFDHAYRAASVAEGYWGPGVGAPEAGRGDLVPVPPAIVVEGAEICRSFKYTGPDNCRAVAAWDDGLVTVASAAARYNPAFYWLIGKPSQPVDGAAAVYVMRLAASLLCAVMIGLAAWAISLCSTTRWPLVGLALALTPIVIYSSAMPAPNGIEMAGALCVWCGLLGLTRSAERQSSLPLLAVATVGAIPMVAVRTLGPLWLILTLMTVLAVFGVKKLLTVGRLRPGAVAVSAALVALSGSAAVWWSRSAGTNALEDIGVAPITPWFPVLQKVPFWFLQSIAAFPLRNEPAPTVVYVCEAIAFVGFVGWAMTRSSGHIRFGIAVTGLLSLAIPYALTLATIETAGPIWQGRYALPFSFGVVLIAGMGLEHVRESSRLSRPLLVAVGCAVAFAHVISVINVQRSEMAGSPLSGDPRWISAPLWLTGSLAALSVACWLTAVLCRFPTSLLADGQAQQAAASTCSPRR